MTNLNVENVSVTELEKGITGIFSSFLAEEKKKALASLSKHEDEPEVQEAAEALHRLDYQKFRGSLLRHHQRISETLVEKVLGDNPRLAFLLINQVFVSRHVRNLFVDIEGSACCADKERTVMRALLRHYHKGARIEFNYDGEYTYHLPQIVLRDHESVVAYFEALYGLYYGNPKAYMQEMLKIAQAAQAARSARETEDS
ncbi:hypothetical protein OIU34_23545 [Pararhizobium sp. BT-229]|uniref:hypothetical protein n=1 Tax=Pararhizobium sp. BT-229 TaxID=2986923 RepID=UPI0021F6F8F4|nr:hypothetical protein [Pararhizobium sp. BT-229]MCV9964871.1 hypothetical protein [Pararhizobium sp. BT-229]